MVHVNLGSIPGQVAGGPSVVQVNVGDEDVVNIGRRQAIVRQSGFKIIQGGGGSGFHQDVAFGPTQQVRGDGVREVLKMEVENIDFHACDLTIPAIGGQTKQNDALIKIAPRLNPLHMAVFSNINI
jgi:hypothetical protein